MALRIDGYKSSDVGTLPNEWDCLPLGIFISTLEAGVSVRSVTDDGLIPSHDDYVLKTSCALKGTFLPHEAKSILAEDRVRARTPVRANTILISRMNTPDLVGEVGYVPLDCDNLYLPDRLWMARPNMSRKTDMRWLSALLSYPPIAKSLKDTATGTSGSMKNISKPSLRKLLLPCPPPDEQQAIAKALGDVDGLIASLEALIAKKRDIKQGAMQELLSGHRRLPGFAGEWEVKRLRELAEKPMQNGVFFQVERKGRGVPMINVGNLYDTSPISLIALDLFDADQSEKDRFHVKDGDLFFTRSSVVPSGIAHCNIVRLQNHDVVVFDSHVIRYSPNNQLVDADFLYRACISPAARTYLISHAKSGTMTTIDQKVLGDCPIALPKLAEQIAIAEVLSDMDAEIAALQAKLAKTRDIKQGMMQVLLTGEVRLI